MAYKTEFVTLKGKTKWFRPYVPDMKFDPPRWRHVLYPDQESLNIIRELQTEGLKNVLKKDEDGYNINLSRPTHLKVRGELRGMSPPTVTLADGVTPFTGNIGNGSDVTTILEVYKHKVPNSTKMAKAARWFSSRIDNLIPFEGVNHMLPDEQAGVKPLMEAPKPTW